MHSIYWRRLNNPHTAGLSKVGARAIGSLLEMNVVDVQPIGIGAEMSSIKIRELLEAGCHFGHKTSRWNPKMSEYIFGSRNGIHIIDLQQTARMYRAAYNVIRDVVASGQDVLFVGTKRQAQDIIREEAERAEQYFMQNRWLGGTLTNFRTIKQSVDQLNKLEEMFEDGSIHNRTKKEVLLLEKDCNKLKANLGGIQKMQRLPGLMFVVDTNKERIAIHEAKKLKIPVVAVCDTNSDPKHIDYPIPGNDDAIRSIRVLTAIAANACIEGKQLRKERPQAEKSEGKQRRGGNKRGRNQGGQRPPVDVRPKASEEQGGGTAA
jgi:small subunit ribosomal protein S2